MSGLEAWARLRILLAAHPQLLTPVQRIVPEAQVRSTEAQRVDLGVQRAQLEHAIAVLAGETPATLVATLAAIPPGLPSELLERRPDVDRAECNVALANACMGAAAGRGVAAARESLQLVENRYRAGTESCLDVISE